MEMTDEEKEAWLKKEKISGIDKWKMGEGNPATQIEGNAENPLFIKVINEIADKNGISDTSAINNSEGQTPIQSS
jgi:hypothetical protein